MEDGTVPCLGLYACAFLILTFFNYYISQQDDISQHLVTWRH